MNDEMIGLRERISTISKPDANLIRDRLRAKGLISKILIIMGGHKSFREPVVVVKKNDTITGWWEIKDGQIWFAPFSTGKIKVLATYSD